MILTTESYDALGTLLPPEGLEIISVFFCELSNEDLMPEPISLGVWVQNLNGNVEPRYLTAAQRDQLVKS